MHYTHALRALRPCAFALVTVASSAALFAAAPRISGTPATSVIVGQTYSFKPSASDADGNKLTFSVTNKPGWASFSSSTGQLAGTPFAEHVRTWSGIVISVTDGTTRVSLPAFSVVVKANPNKTPTITGSPATTAKVGQAYSFQPVAKDPEGKTVTFSIRNKPSWASFSTSTGKLSGTPTSAGTNSYVMIIVTDGVSSAALPWFNITVSGSSTSGGGTGSASLSWTPPTRNTDGSTLTDLAGYRIMYGTSASSLSKSITVADPRRTSYAVTNLASGTWYFALKAYTSSGAESAASSVASKRIP
jgi:hypothetical protein